MKKFLITLLTFLMLSCACFAETVFFNTKTHKFHNFSCQWAAKCTKNCIKIERQQAVKRGGVPCKVCGG